MNIFNGCEITKVLRVNYSCFFFCVLLILPFTLLTSCAGTGKRSEITPAENNIEKIAVIGESKIFYPRMRNKTPVLDLADSKKALGIHLPRVEKIFVDKGYEVTYVKPAGVGYFYINGDNWVTEDNGNSEKKWQIKSGDPVYEYSEIKEDERFHYIVRKAFERAVVADERWLLDRFKPVKYEYDLSVLHEHTGADTVCFVRLFGNKYTAKRKLGDAGLMVLGALVGAYGGSISQDITGSHITCINALSGTVLWNKWISVIADPVETETEIIESLLKSFPKKSEPLNTAIY